MLSVLASVMLPLLRQMDPERAHGIALRALRLGLMSCEELQVPIEVFLHQTV